MTHGIGDNLPPVDLPSGEILRQKLLAQYPQFIARRDDLQRAFDLIPPITNEDLARDVGDYVKQITALVKAAEAARVAEKEPYLAAARIVDAAFKVITDPLLKM
jgi:hypothetical protein